MFMRDGKYDSELHHKSHLAVGVPGTVAGLHLAWKERGKLRWKQLVEPAIALARDGFPVSHGLAASLKQILPQMRKYPCFGRAVLEKRHGIRARRHSQTTGSSAHVGADRRARPDLASTREKLPN
jgi:gamma-glutamyltranspeptidase